MSRLAEPASPCVGTCRLDPLGAVCMGCLRTLDEIGAWASADAATKREILDRVARRRPGRLAYAPPCPDHTIEKSRRGPG